MKSRQSVAVDTRQQITANVAAATAATTTRGVSSFLPPGLRHRQRLAAAAQHAAKSTEFKQEMERLLIVGKVRSPAETRELMLQAEAQYVQFVRETGASID